MLYMFDALPLPYHLILMVPKKSELLSCLSAYQYAKPSYFARQALHLKLLAYKPYMQACFLTC